MQCATEPLPAASSSPVSFLNFPCPVLQWLWRYSVLSSCLISIPRHVFNVETSNSGRHTVDRREHGQYERHVTRRSWLRQIFASVAGAITLFIQPPPLKAQSCQDWFRCNQWGCLCSCRGGSDYSCPPGTTNSTQSWYACCYDPGRQRAFIVRYIDCCQSTQPPACPSGCFCARGQAQPNWCGGGRYVVCTRAVLVGVC